mmetsp:Transcript_17271/g.42907  ORF Transcript_17271/g.42907 Transcript_17271/m.42907 type:complete len:255 (-) Transcript_17271:515-1279(-)
MTLKSLATYRSASTRNGNSGVPARWLPAAGRDKIQLPCIPPKGAKIRARGIATSSRSRPSSTPSSTSQACFAPSPETADPTACKPPLSSDPSRDLFCGAGGASVAPPTSYTKSARVAKNVSSSHHRLARSGPAPGKRPSASRPRRSDKARRVSHTPCHAFFPKVPATIGRTEGSARLRKVLPIRPHTSPRTCVRAASRSYKSVRVRSLLATPSSEVCSSSRDKTAVARSIAVTRPCASSRKVCTVACSAPCRSL